MKHISVLVPKGDSVLSSIVGPYKIFRSVNQYALAKDPKAASPFQVELVGLDERVELYDGAFSVRPDQMISEVQKTDLIIIPAVMGDVSVALQRNEPFVHWIREQRARHNTEVASLCMGAFILASTGLVDGKNCSTHWIGADAFRRLFPRVQLTPEHVITEDDGIYSSGGAYSFLNLILHLVEKYQGRETAIWCAKMFEIDIDRSNQSQFAVFRGQFEHGDEAIRDTQLYIEEHFAGRLTIDELADRVAISRRNFIRRFKNATANTPIEYIQRVKIEVAKKSLESSSENVMQIMYQVGYTDTKAFRNVFRKLTGLSPLDYRNKYNRHAAVV
jgi:transcriptional regulator GlxA family with amidase domain